MGAWDAIGNAMTYDDQCFFSTIAMLESLAKRIEKVPDDVVQLELHGADIASELMGVEPHVHDPRKEYTEQLEEAAIAVRAFNKLYVDALAWVPAYEIKEEAECED